MLMCDEKMKACCVDFACCCVMMVSFPHVMLMFPGCDDGVSFNANLVNSFSFFADTIVSLL